jgi:hypothetical protein
MATYRALPDNLKEFADIAKKYLAKELGLGIGSMTIEGEIHPEIDFRPTINVLSGDKHLICAEVVENDITLAIERFVLSCKNHALPVKLYVVVGKGAVKAYDPKQLRFARENGVSILEVSPPSNGVLINNPPLSLSLGGLRGFNLQEFPSKYREPLRQAIETFKGGNPAKGCSDVYDELEQLTRRIGKKCEKKANGLKKAAGFDWDVTGWSNILEFLKNNLNKTVVGCPNLSDRLFSRVIGMTDYRNEVGHKPSSLRKRIERDTQLKTRFESAMDELKAWIDASKALRV